jgi:hypothetical protein
VSRIFRTLVSELVTDLIIRLAMIRMMLRHLAATPSTYIQTFRNSSKQSASGVPDSRARDQKRTHRNWIATHTKPLQDYGGYSQQEVPVLFIYKHELLWLRIAGCKCLVKKHPNRVTRIKTMRWLVAGALGLNRCNGTVICLSLLTVL